MEKDSYDTVCRTVDPHTFPIPNRSSHAPVTSTSPSDNEAIQQAASVLRDDLPVAFPTETVYGLGANATSSTAVSTIFRAKGRPSDNPLIVHISSLSQLSQILPPSTSLPDVYTHAITRFWPGPLTILVPRGPNIPLTVTAGHETVAVRFPSHPVARALIDACGFPIAAPSANTSGRPSPTLASHVQSDLHGRIPMIIDGGPSDGGVESTVLDGLRSPPAILRPGGVTWEALRELPGLESLKVYRRDFTETAMEAAPTTPGMKYRHYSPEAEVVLFELSEQKAVDGGVGEKELASGTERMRVAVDKEIARLRSLPLPSDTPLKIGVMRTWSSNSNPSSNSISGSNSRDNTVEEYILGDANSPEAVARHLFRGLRELEDRGAKVILVEGILEDREGLAVMNRVRKAASRVITC
ncbi:hypothetical protein HDV00_003084 [Rhizophlyctis rosea]|nr:hypothetical protein HDV00_003084 [Rhizophlyctis rosea]